MKTLFILPELILKLFILCILAINYLFWLFVQYLIELVDFLKALFL